jgi:hypothetical protein
MKELYTYSSLQSDLQLFLGYVNIQSFFYFLAFDTLYSTGCRPAELFAANRWQNYSDSQVSLQPLKGNNIRYIEKSLLNVEVVKSIVYDDMITAKLSRPTLDRYFLSSYPSRQTFILSTSDFAEIGLYLFRHFAFKRKFMETGDRTAVGNYFGEVDIKNTNGYIDSELYFTS